MTTRPNSPNGPQSPKGDLHAKAPATALLEPCTSVVVSTDTAAWRDFDAHMTHELESLELRFPQYVKPATSLKASLGR